MIVFFIALGIGIAAFLLGSYYCYRTAFAVPKKYRTPPQELPSYGEYGDVQQKMQNLVNRVLELPFEEVWIQSSTGERLYGRYYETKAGAPLQILFHGYRSNALRDFCGGLQLALESGCNALLVDQRAHGNSQGRCLSFGILERKDCLDWVHYAVARFGPETRILLTGISMGAATVLMAAALPLPSNVVGIIGDCGYSSPKAIIQKVIPECHYPLHPTYELLRVGGMIYGGFDIESADVPRALAKAQVPVLLIHGEADDFVPYEMSRENHAACRSDCTLFSVPEAGHGLSYIFDYQGYCNAIKDFLKKVL